MIRNGIVRKEVDEIGIDMSSAAQPELGANSSLSEVKQPSYLPTAKSTSENDLTRYRRDRVVERIDCSLITAKSLNVRRISRLDTAI